MSVEQEWNEFLFIRVRIVPLFVSKENTIVRVDQIQKMTKQMWNWLVCNFIG